MCSMAEVEEAVDAVSSQDNKNLILLHCVSAYPTDPRDVNLRAMKTMQKSFNLPVGYSDHTIGNITSMAAIALGAHVLEKHFTLDKKFEGSDHVLSADEKDLNEISKARQQIFTSLGTGIKKPSYSESLSINTQRKSLFTKKEIKAGEKINLENITVKGPGHGLLPKYLPLILGKSVTRDIANDMPIIWDDVLKS